MMGGLPSGLSQRDEQVLHLVAAVRVASAVQVERGLFPAAEGSQLSAARRCRRVLARLSDSGHLYRLSRRQGGSKGGSSSYLYALGTKGRQALGLPGRARRTDPGERFLLHCLATTQLHVDLLAAERTGRCTDLRIEHEPGNWRRFSRGMGSETLKPDLLVELTTPQRWELRWWVEVDRATEHRPAILAKCLLYQDYWQSGAELARHPVFPRVLWSVPDERRADELRNLVAGEPRLEPELFRVATVHETLKLLLAEQPTEAAS